MFDISLPIPITGRYQSPADSSPKSAISESVPYWIIGVVLLLANHVIDPDQNLWLFSVLFTNKSNKGNNAKEKNQGMEAKQTLGKVGP